MLDAWTSQFQKIRHWFSEGPFQKIKKKSGFYHIKNNFMGSPPDWLAFAVLLCLSLLGAVAIHECSNLKIERVKAQAEFDYKWKLDSMKAVQKGWVHGTRKGE